MEPDRFEQFCEEFTREVNRLRMEHSAETIARKRERERIERELDKAIQPILDGVPGAQLKDKIGRLEAVEVLRSLIDEIRLAPKDGKLAIVLRGDLAAMLSHSADK